ncbi:MAG: hypothetical protein IH898_13220, partial [Planctomycetes bacterium]|nr:hypothetical protein [Planctomycetota bacterium]
MNRLAAIGILFALVAFHGTQPDAGEDFDGTRAEKELITLLNSIDEQYKTFRHKSRAMDDPDQQAEFRKTSDPAHECVPTLLAFEDQNRGTLVGLMALRRIVDMAGRRGHVGNPSAQGRRKVLNRLSNYVDRPELLAILGHLGSGTFEPRVADTLRTIAEDEGADPLVRGYSKLTLGRWMLNVRDKHEFSERRIHALSEGFAP